jgi:hypothetical protein
MKKRIINKTNQYIKTIIKWPHKEMIIWDKIGKHRHLYQESNNK